MDLPVDIEIKIADYLNMEFGAYEERAKIISKDLNYEGEFLVDGKVIRYWKFPCSTKPGCWATVELVEPGYMIGMTTDPPNR